MLCDGPSFKLKSLLGKHFLETLNILSLPSSYITSNICVINAI